MTYSKDRTINRGNHSNLKEEVSESMTIECFRGKLTIEFSFFWSLVNSGNSKMLKNIEDVFLETDVDFLSF